MAETEGAIREKAAKAGRMIWAGMVVLATLGGVVGFYQFFSDNNDDPKAAPQTVVLRMVESGDLSPTEAAALIDMLGGSESGQAVKTLTTGTDKQKEALQLVAVSPTFERGISILESEAKSAADWRLIADLSQRRDPKRAVKAARKAIALAPEDFDTLRLLVTSQMMAGDFSDARRSQVGLAAIAQTPLERLKAAIAEGDLAYATRRPEAANAAIASLSKGLEVLEPLEGLPLDPASDLPLEEALLSASEGLATRGSLYFVIDEFAKIEPDVQRAIAILESGLDRLSGRNLRDARQRLSMYHDMRATAKHRLNQISDHHEAHEKSIAQYRAMADAGDASAREALPTRLMNLAGEYADLGEPDLALERMGEALERFEVYAADFPDNRKVEMQRYSMKAMMSVLSGDVKAAQSTYKAAMDSVKEALLAEGDPEQLSQVSGLIYNSFRTFYRVEDRTPAILTTLHAPGMQTLSAFERRYGSSKELTLERYNLRMNLIGTLMTAEADPEETQSAARQLISDLAKEDSPDIDADTLDTYRVYALHLLAQTKPDDATDIAQQGLDIARSLDRKGKLDTRMQQYIALFEALLKPDSE